MNLLTDSSFQANLGNSLESLSLETIERHPDGTLTKVRSLANLGEYWLNQDGTVTRKESWLGRIVRWILDLFFNKTLNDIWSVFQRAMQDFETMRMECSKKRYNPKYVYDKLDERRERLLFATKFLLSRKHSFDTWVSFRCPEKRVYLRENIQHYQTLSRRNLNELVNTLERIYIPDVNGKMLSKTPPIETFQVTPEDNPQVYQMMDLNEFVPMADQDPNVVGMINAVKTRDPDLPGIGKEIRDEYYAQLELYLKNILFCVKRDKSVPREKIRAAIKELVNAASLCPPRWLEESRMQYRFLIFSQNGYFEGKILEHIQNAKEEIFLRMFDSMPGVEFHIINSCRKAFGKEFGLNRKNVKLDVYAYRAGPGFLSRIRNTFLQSYTGQALVKGVKQRINLELGFSWDASYLLFLRDRLVAKAKDMNDPHKYVIEHYTEYNGKRINTEGTIMLLRELGFLN